MYLSLLCNSCSALRLLYRSFAIGSGMSLNLIFRSKLARVILIFLLRLVTFSIDHHCGRRSSLMAQTIRPKLVPGKRLGGNRPWIFWWEKLNLYFYFQPQPFCLGRPPEALGNSEANEGARGPPDPERDEGSRQRDLLLLRDDQERWPADREIEDLDWHRLCLRRLWKAGNGWGGHQEDEWR